MLTYSYVTISKALARCLVVQTLPAQHSHSQLSDYECVLRIHSELCAAGDLTGSLNDWSGDMLL